MISQGILMIDNDDVFLPARSAFLTDTLARLIQKDIDPSIDVAELRRRGFGFWVETLENGQNEFTIFHNGVEISFADFLLELCAEKLKCDFIRDCRRYREEAVATQVAAQ
jgi:hypothetical protein